MRKVLVAISLYKNEQLIAPLFASLKVAAADFAAINGRLLLIVDSPDYSPLLNTLEIELPGLKEVIETEVLINHTNLGFLKSMNIALQKAIAETRDVIILNSDVEVFPGALSEIRDVAYLDHMIGFVSPRSNNATICSLPTDPKIRAKDPLESYERYRIIAKYLPRYRYAFTAVGFCMFIKWTMLYEFGIFDEVYGQGYNEENDLVMRANRRGYRAALANHAFVYHIGEQSFALTNKTKNVREETNYRILLNRYPEYERSLRREQTSPEATVEHILQGFLHDEAGRPVVAFDWNNIGAYHNGTFELARRLVETAAIEWKNKYNIVVVAPQKVSQFHGIDRIPNIRVIHDHGSEVYAAIIRVGQPFNSHDVNILCNYAPVVGVYMQDTIALDCQQLDGPGLQFLWQDTFDKINLILYNSNYTKNQFRSRFQIPSNTVEVASLLSLDVNDYNRGLSGCHDRDGPVLVVGNPFPHKYLDATLQRILALYPHEKVNVLGSSTIKCESIRIFETGSLSDDEVADLYSSARAVLFPSHYEGFGFPVLHALANRTPVVVRAMPINDELKEALQNPNIHIRDTTDEMIHTAFNPDLHWIEQGTKRPSPGGWKRVVCDLDKGIAEALSRVNYNGLLARFQRIKLGELPSRTNEPDAGSISPWTAAARFVLALIAIGVFANAAFLAIRGYSALPFWDQWGYVDPAKVASKVFEYHNEHRALSSKLLSIADLTLASGSNILLFVAIYLIQAAHVGVFYFLGRRAGVTSPIGTALLLATLVCAFFGAQNVENLTWAFQTSFVMVFFTATCSFFCLAKYHEDGSRRFLVFAAISAFVSTLEMANGILVWPLLIFQAFCCGMPRKAKAFLVLASIVALLSFSYGRMDFQSPSPLIPTNPIVALYYALAYIGSYVGQTIWEPVGTTIFLDNPRARAYLYIACGLAIVLTSFCAFSLILWRKRRASPSLIGLACVLLFAIGTAGVTATGRAALGFESVFASRYCLGGALAFAAAVSIVLVALPFVPSRASRILVQASIMLLLAFIALTQAFYINVADSRRDGIEKAATALLTGVRDESALRLAFANPDLVWRGALDLKRYSRSVFREDRAKLLGRHIFQPPAECVLQVVAVPTRDQFLLRGTTSTNPFRFRPLDIFVIDENSRVVGLGAVSLKLDVRRLRDRNANWYAYVQPNGNGPLTVIKSSSHCKVVARDA